MTARSIVVAVDGSAQGLAGVRFAAPLATAMGVELELAFVSPPNLLLPSVYPEAHQQVEEAAVAHAEQVLGAARAVAAEAGAVATGIHLRDGNADAVADFARAERVYAVVVGARGHRALSRVLLGSFADRLVHVCSKPVFVVR